MLNPKALDAFRSIVMTGSTTAAAETMRISQPAVSRLLKSLERTLGYALFQRVRGRLSPTPEGLALFEEVERFFRGLEHLERVAQQINKNRGQSYRVAAMPTVGLRFVPKVISRLGPPADLPVFSLTVVPSQTVAGLMLSRQCNLGIMSGAIDESGMQVIGEYTVDCLCILPPGHPLAERETVAWTDFANRPLVALDGTTIVGSRTGAALKRAGVQPTVTIETHLSPIVSAAVMNGSGIAVVDLFAAQEHAERGGGVRPLAAPVPFEFKVVKPASEGTTAIQRRLLDVFTAEVAALKAGLSSPNVHWTPRVPDS